jgi:hypothetical protein
MVKSKCWQYLQTVNYEAQVCLAENVKTTKH